MRFGAHPLRLRLTLLYCLVSVVSSAVLLVIMWALARGLDTNPGMPPQPPHAPQAPQAPQPPQPPQAPQAPQPPQAPPVPQAPLPPHAPQAPQAPLPPQPPQAPQAPQAPLIDAGGFSTGTLVQPLIALAIMAVISLFLGWLIAGRVLRPVLTMTERLHQISERNVHERLALPGRRNELKDLADTVDGLLGRLETALDAHKRFVANAAHEMRTPLTVERALLEEPLIDPEASLESFRSNFERLLVISDQRGQLLESLLTLSSSEHSRGADDVVDLADLVEVTLRERAPEIERCGLRVRTSLQPTRVPGDQMLLSRLLVNLCDNAIHHNVPGGTVEITVHRELGHVALSVANSGEVIPADQVDRLFEPFQRLHRTADGGHHGLGLSIVRAITRAHGATLTARPRPQGGFVVDVEFPMNADEPVNPDAFADGRG